MFMDSPLRSAIRAGAMFFLNGPAFGSLTHGKPPAEADNSCYRESARGTMNHHPANAVRTSGDRLTALAGCGDTASLRSAVSELCAEFGKVTRIDILTMSEAEKRQALCFLRLESAAQERQLMTNLGASRFGDDLLVIFDLASM
jgi:hypothetical protein